MSEIISNKNTYFVVNIPQKDLSDSTCLESWAFDCGSTGIEEYSLNEETVDAMLGERSYSGGDLPESVLDEVDDRLDDEQNKFFRIYFSREQDAKAFQDILEKNLNAKFDFHEETFKDWNAEWKKHYTPIWVNEELEIIPAWDKDIQSKAQNKLLIYPGMGFGTGSHETTFLCLQSYTLNKNEIQHKRCLDFGCGSGILGLAVLLFVNSCEVDLYDIDTEALHNCKQNIELNKMENYAIRLLSPSERTQINGTYDIVFANILQNVLEGEKEIILNSLSDNGLLIVSGLLKGQETAVIKSYQNYSKNLKLISIDLKNDWVSITFKKEV